MSTAAADRRINKPKKKHMPQRSRLTDAIVAKFGPKLSPGRPPEQQIYWDSTIGGLGVRTTPAAIGPNPDPRSRSYVLDYRDANGRQHRATLGATTVYTVAQARRLAAEWKRAIAEGRDPLKDREEKRTAPTVADLIDRYVNEALPLKRERTQAEDRALLRDYIRPALGQLKVEAVEAADIEKLHRRITQAGKKTRANRALTLVKTIFNKAIRWKMRSTNPCAGIERNPEHGRERFLTHEELPRLDAALDRYQLKKPVAVDVIRTLLLTGARLGEVCRATWDQFDLTEGIWVKPATLTKQKRMHRIPLSPPALEILRRRHAEREQRRVVLLRRQDEDLVFGYAAADKTEKAWRVIRGSAGLDDVRLHDLRHSYASLLVQAGLSLPIIGRLLGHSQPQTTNRYAHLSDAPLREATQLVGRIVGGAKGSSKS
jgi:integrase